jgi:hypothetical protein
MACSSLVALARACGADGIMGGLEKLYMVAFADTVVPAGATDNNIYTLSAGGLISAIGLNTGKLFVEIGLLNSSAGLKETLTKDNTKGTAYFTQELTVVLSDLSTDNETFVTSVLRQPVVVVLKTRTGNYYAAGLNGQLELSALDGGTGTADGDLIGYNLTFSGVSINLIPQVDSTIITTLTVGA